MPRRVASSPNWTLFQVLEAEGGWEGYSPGCAIDRRTFNWRLSLVGLQRKLEIDRCVGTCESADPNYNVYSPAGRL